MQHTAIPKLLIVNCIILKFIKTISNTYLPILRILPVDLSKNILPVNSTRPLSSYGEIDNLPKTKNRVKFEVDKRLRSKLPKKAIHFARSMTHRSLCILKYFVVDILRSALLPMAQYNRLPNLSSVDARIQLLSLG